MKNTILSILRHALTFGGGFVIAKGYLGEDTVNQLIAAVPPFVALVWGAVDEYLAENAKPKADGL